MKLPISRLAKTIAPAAMRTVSYSKSDRTIEFQNWIILILTVAILFINNENLQVNRRNLISSARNAENTANMLNELKELNKKIGDMKK